MKKNTDRQMVNGETSYALIRETNINSKFVSSVVCESVVTESGEEASLG